MSHDRGGSVGSSSRAFHLVNEDEDDIPLGQVIEGVRDEPIYEVQGAPPINTSGPVYNSTVVRSVLDKERNIESDLYTRRHMQGLRNLYDIPDWVNLHAPDENLRANHSFPGYVCMYEQPFKDGLRLPLPDLVVKFLRRYQISPGQLLPNAYRVLMAIQVFSEIEKLEVDVLDVLHTYRFSEYGSSGRFQLVCRTNRPHVITGIEDKGRWKGKYFFMSYEGLGLSPGDDIPLSWTHGSGFGADFEVSLLNFEERVGRFTVFPESRRHWKTILSPENLRRTSLWSQVPLVTKGIVVPETQIRAKIVLGVRALEVLGYNSIPLLPFDKLTLDERAYADHVMSKKLNLIPTGDVYEMLEERRSTKTRAARGKKGKSGAGPKGDTGPQEIMPSGPSRKKRAAVLDVSGGSDGDGMVHLSISSDTCAQRNYGSVADQVEKLLFEGDMQILDNTGGASKAVDRAIEHSFQNYQVMLYLRKKLGKAESALTEALQERDALVEEMGSSRQRWSETEKALLVDLAHKDEEISALLGDLARKDEEISTLQSERTVMKETLAAREEQIKDIFLETAVITRGQVYQEYMDGKAPT